MSRSLLNPFTLWNVFLELAASEHCAILRLNVQPAKTFMWHTTVQNVCICVCEGGVPVLGASLGVDLSPDWTPGDCCWARVIFRQKVSCFPGILVVISCLNYLPISCWNAKKTSYKTTNVSYLPIWCIPAKTEQHYQNICWASKSQQRLSNKQVWSQSILPSPLYEQRVWVLPTCSQVSCPVLSFPSFLNLFKEIYSTHYLEDSSFMCNSFSTALSFSVVCLAILLTSGLCTTF